MVERINNTILSKKEKNEKGILTIIFLVLILVTVIFLPLILIWLLLLAGLSGSFVTSFLEYYRIMVTVPDYIPLGVSHLIKVLHFLTLVLSIILVFFAYKYYSRKLLIVFMMTLIIALPPILFTETGIFQLMFGRSRRPIVEKSVKSRANHVKSPVRKVPPYFS